MGNEGSTEAVGSSTGGGGVPSGLIGGTDNRQGKALPNSAPSGQINNVEATLEYARRQSKEYGQQATNDEPKAELSLAVVDITSVNQQNYSKLAAYLRMKVGEIRGIIQENSANNFAGFSRQYTQIHAGDGSPATASVDEHHRHLNRYGNIVAYDHSRVKVTPNEFNGQTDYINANYINGSDFQYIAAQGPVPDSFPAFWQMVFENDVQLIIMVTNEVEKGRLKCHRYWPSPEEGQRTYGQYTLKNEGEDVRPQYVMRTFSLLNNNSNVKREITQFAYTAWPDHGVPATTTELLQFRMDIRQQVGTQRSTVLTHCSAGVGRTGTFIGLDRYLSEALAMKSNLSVISIVEDMRKNRNFLVQSQIQFVFLHLACLDGMERILKKIEREIEMDAMSDSKKKEAQMDDIEREIEVVANQFKSSLGVAVDARHAEGKPTDDVHQARRVPALQRRASLIEAVDDKQAAWKKRGNVPLAVSDKGYQVDRAADVTQRLDALQDQREAWKLKYDAAQRGWHAGESYEVKKQMTPLESRLTSLQNCESAWLARRKDGFRSAKEEDVKRTMAGLALRLQSLQITLDTSAQRWKARGSGFQQLNHDSHKKEHTVDRLGTLADRLSSLQQDEDAWITRGNIPQYLGKETFEHEVGQERKKLEQKRQQENERQAVLEDQKAMDAEKQRQLEQAKMQKAREEKKEAERREAVKAKMRKSAVVEKSYDPSTEARKKEQAMDKKKQKEEEKKRKEEEKKRLKKMKEDAKIAKKEAAKNKAASFLSKMK